MPQRWNWILVAALAVLPACATAPPAAPTPPAAPPPTTLQVGDTTVLAVSPPTQPCCPKPTLLDFLGITQVCKGGTGLLQRIGSRIRNRLGMFFPGLEPKPPLLSITDPANLAEDSPPAVKTAAEVKQEEDAAPQKIKALRYLATIGCGGCYPGIEEAFLAALDDCTEEVRYEAVLAIRGTASIPCQFCKNEACCSEKIRKKLDELAYKTNSAGCYVEGSDRVRRVARLGLAACGSPAEPPSVMPEEGPAVEVPANPGTATAAAPSTPTPGSAPTAPQIAQLASPTSGSEMLEVPAELVHARVNGAPIRGADLIRRLTSLNNGVPSVVGRWPRRAVEQALRAAIDDELIRQAAEARRVNEVTLTSAEVGTITREEMVAYYQEHRQEYGRPTEVRWELATVPRSSVATRQQAYAVLDYVRARAMGEAVSPAGNLTSEMVRTKTYDWTDAREVAPSKLGATLARLPEGKVSGVIEDDTGWHVLRVIERRGARTKEFEEVAEQIQERIAGNRQSLARARLIQDLRASAIIWSVMDLTPAQPDPRVASEITLTSSAAPAPELMPTASSNPQRAPMFRRPCCD